MVISRSRLQIDDDENKMTASSEETIGECIIMFDWPRNGGWGAAVTCQIYTAAFIDGLIGGALKAFLGHVVDSGAWLLA